MFNQELVDKISDDFQSTFTFFNKNTIQNMALDSEVDEVEKIILKYLPGVKIKVTRAGRVGAKGIYQWQIS